MNITISTKVLQENHLSLGDFLMLLIGFYGIDYKKCLENLVRNGVISPNVWGDNSVVMSNNTKDMIANILVNSDEKVANSPIDFTSLALKMQECYPEGCKPGTSYEWRGKTEEIALKLKTLIAIHDFSFTEEEAIKAVKEYVSSFEDKKRIFEYHNEDGTLKDNVFTRTQYDNTINNNNQRSDANESNNTRNAETSAREQQASNGGLLADAQSRIKRGSRDGGEAQKQGVLSEEDIDKRNQEDRESLEKFAKEQGKWVEDIDPKLEKKYGKRIGHGSEAWVYLKDKNTVIKSRSFTGYDTIQDALRSIELHNTLFPETAMKVVGFGTSDGEFTVVVEQPYIADGTYASNEEIEEFIKSRFEAEKDSSVTGGTSYKTGKYLLQDLKPQNVFVRIVNGEKQYSVIDGDFYDNPFNVFQSPISSEVEVEDVMKPWRNDPSKSNKSRRIYLKGQKDKGYFEVVKDLEDNDYSVHFKPTDSKNPNAFTQEEKAILFQAVADVIPEGANLSTWGELTKGGVHGLNRFADLGFTKTGERQVKMKSGEDITIPIFTKTKNTLIDQLVSHIRSIGANVFNRAAMAEYLKTHKIEGLQQFVSKDSLPKGELPSLSSALLTKYNNNTVYGETVHTANYEYTVNYKGAGEFDIIEYHPIDNNVNNNYNDRERKGFPGSLDGLSSRDEITQGEYNSDSYNVEDGEANGNNAGLDKQTSQRESKQSQSNDGSSQDQGWIEIKRDDATGRIAFVDGDGRTISTAEDWNRDSNQLFITPQGEVYGFVDKDGNIYLDETKISPEHPIHEYTHLWDRTVQKKNPKLWQRGIELMKQTHLEDGTSLWDTVLNEDNYGKVWQSKNLPQEKLESLIASEIHSRLVGEGGEKLLNDIAKQKGQEGIIGKLKQWILDFWKDLKATFGTWSQEEIDNLEIGDFNRMTVRDLAEDNQACVVIEP